MLLVLKMQQCSTTNKLMGCYMKKVLYVMGSLFALLILVVVGLQILYRTHQPLYERLIQLSDRNIYSYGDIKKTGLLTLDVGRKAIYINDYKVSGSFCDSSDNYECVNTQGFRFAVPKNIRNGADKWSLYDNEYEISTVEEKPLQFQSISDLVVIRSTERSGTKLDYFYSPTWGLLGFKQWSKGSDAPLLLTTRGCTGFGGSRSGSLLGYILHECWNSK